MVEAGAMAGETARCASDIRRDLSWRLALLYTDLYCYLLLLFRLGHGATLGRFASLRPSLQIWLRTSLPPLHPHPEADTDTCEFD